MRSAAVVRCGRRMVGLLMVVLGVGCPVSGLEHTIEQETELSRTITESFTMKERRSLAI